MTKKHWLIVPKWKKNFTGKSPICAGAPGASGIQLIEVLANILGDKPYFLGDKIHTLDMSVYAFLANIIDQPYANPLQDLMNYCQQIKQLAWRDWRTTTQ